jgi:hypothetical protein
MDDTHDLDLASDLRFSLDQPLALVLPTLTLLKPRVTYGTWFSFQNKAYDSV